MSEEQISEDRKALAIMAHDIKAPLTAIKDLLDVIARGYVDDFEKIKELVVRADQKAGTLIAMVDDILDYTLLADKTLMKREKVYLFEVLNESIAIMRPYADKSHIEITQDLEALKGKFVSGNYTFLLRVFNNIVMNAVKYNREKGKIHVQAWENTQNATLGVKVEDTGIGIPADEQEKIFKIFERGRYARRNVNGSLGLGLSLVQQIVKDHDGTIELESSEGVGTSIVVTLPLDSPGGPGDEGEAG